MSNRIADQSIRIDRLSMSHEQRKEEETYLYNQSLEKIKILENKLESVSNENQNLHNDVLKYASNEYINNKKIEELTEQL